MTPNYDKNECRPPYIVAYAHNDTVVASVFRRQLGPEARELIVGRSALVDDGTIPASVVVLHLHSLMNSPSCNEVDTYNVDDNVDI